jgi:hypothetical protein
MDFAAGKWEGVAIGIPYNVISASKEPKQKFNFLYNDESDVGPYPVNSSFRIEEGEDHHLLSLDKETCKLYEIFNARNEKGWKGDSGAIWDLKSNAFRPIDWTSADAAGLPILPGLVRYDEVAAGVINHAIRFTIQATNSYIWPGTHLTSGEPGKLTSRPPMGARFRLREDYDISQFDPKIQVILKAMKTYGIINADNGGNWFVSGVPDPRWNDELLSSLKKVTGSAFEAVDASCMMIAPDSGKANLSKCPVVSQTPTPPITKDKPTVNVPNLADTGCTVFPADNVWNTPIDKLPVHANSKNWVPNIGGGTSLHLDFGAEKWEGNEIGIPYNVLNASREPKVPFNFLYSDESDAGPYPVGVNPRIEQGSDHHLITLDKETCKVYEIFNASNDNGWQGDSGAIWDLKSNAMRPISWTSADAAGLPILPGLIRYEEVAALDIKHALRFTAEKTNGYVWPGSHLTSGEPGVLNAFQPPLGARFRLKASYDISQFDPYSQAILKAMKTYGIILADNGGDWYLSGTPDSRWNDEVLHDVFIRIKGAAFEAVDESCMMVSPNSAQADLSKCAIAPAKERCSYGLSKTTKSFKATGGIDAVDVKLGDSSCTWTARSNASWLPIYVQAEKNTQRVIYAVAKNKTGAPRSGTVTIAGKTFTVKQAK